VTDLFAIFAIVFFCFAFALMGYDIGRQNERDGHRPHCFCEECKHWRESRRKEGKEPEV
jgi:hypothetical protein